MSKSLGNSPDPLDLIEKYGADGVRVGMLLCSPAGNDLMFDESYCEQGRNFANKVWNAFRLVMGWNVVELEQPSSNKLAGEWFRAKMAATIVEINDHFEKFRISDALMSMYKLIWDDFCSWYLEMIKPGYEAPIDNKTFDEVVLIFEDLLKLMHPFMPFISEEIWQTISERKEKDFLIVAKWPTIKNENSELLSKFENARDIIVGVRGIRNEKNIALKVKLNLNF
jgi:valyl-tRNA synthetase